MPRKPEGNQEAYEKLGFLSRFTIEWPTTKCGKKFVNYSKICNDYMEISWTKCFLSFYIFVAEIEGFCVV